MKKPVKINLNSVKKTLKEMKSDKGKLGLTLLEEAEFMKTTLEELKQKVIDNGVITEMCQGEYTIERANPALNQYNSLIKNYNSIVKQITDLLTEQPAKTLEDEFDDFNK